VRPAVGVLHAASLADLDEVLQGLRRALLPLALLDCLSGLQLFELAIDDDIEIAVAGANITAAAIIDVMLTCARV